MHNWSGWRGLGKGSRLGICVVHSLLIVFINGVIALLMILTSLVIELLQKIEGQYVAFKLAGLIHLFKLYSLSTYAEIAQQFLSLFTD